MSSSIPFPNNRLIVPGTGNPRFTTDIENATQNINEAVEALLGIAGIDNFAILGGLHYSSGSYSPGIIYSGGQLYACVAGLVENRYLIASNQDILNKTFENLTVHPTYRCYYAIQSSSNTGFSPIFTGNMDQYRLTLKSLKDITNTHTANINNLGGYVDTLVDFMGTVYLKTETYSKLEINAYTGLIKHKRIPFTWDMNATANLTIDLSIYGITVSSIVSVEAYIKPNEPSDYFYVNLNKGGICSWGITSMLPVAHVYMERTTSGIFDDPNYDGIGERGHIIILHT